MCRNLRDTLSFTSPVPQLLHPPNKCDHDSSIATVRFPGQGLQDSRHAAPIWSETILLTRAPRPPQPCPGLPCPRAPSTLCRSLSDVALRKG
jgi:hypothetical protein